MLNQPGVSRFWKYAPDLQAQAQPFLVAASQAAFTIRANTYIKLIDGSVHTIHPFEADQNFTLSSILDTGVLQAGKDYSLYRTPSREVIASLNSTFPSGYDEKTRKIGGLHTLCAEVGAISGHPGSGFVAGAIIPNSIWCLNHRPHLHCSPAGMAFVDWLNLWCDIYLMSSIGATTASAYGAVITDSRNWMNCRDDLAAVGKRYLLDHEFQIAARLSNEATNIFGSSDPNTTGGHVDTANRRMISAYFLEDMCGAMYQWLGDQSTRWDGSGGWGWRANTGGKGNLYIGGDTNDVKLLAGGSWGNGSNCGSRCRGASNFRWDAASDRGARGCAEPA